MSFKVDVRVDWVVFDEGKSSWEPLATKWDGARSLSKVGAAVVED